MDHKRNIIIFGLAVVSYLLLLAWNKDNPAVLPVDNNAAVLSEAQDLQDLPSVGTNSDVPQISTAIGEPVVNSSSTNLISIKTPVQEVIIDLVGGDIVGVSLPTFPSALETPDDPFRLLRNDSSMVYVAQSGLVGRNGPDASSSGRPRYTSASSEYSLESGQLAVDLTTQAKDVSITKRYTFSADDFLIGVEYLISNNSSLPFSANLYGQIKRDASLDPSKTGGGGLGIRTFLGAAMTSEDDPYMKASLEDMDDGVPSIEMIGGWIGFSQHYFLGSWIPASTEKNTFSARKNNNGQYLIGFVGPEKTVQPGEQLQLQASFWAGPKDQYRLENIAPNLGQTIDYGKLWFVGYPIFWVLSRIYAFVGNFGLAIICLTIVIRTLFLPLSAKQFSSQAKMKKLQPKVAQLKDRYGDDKQKFMQAQMELWKKEKVNPFSGCLPVLLQMPVFLGIYWVLNESVELRQAPFILWYNDLSLMDSYFVLPLLLGGAYFLQQHMTPMPTTDPAQAKMMKWMPVMFTGFFLWLPAGLVLYYLVNTLLGILQQFYFSRKIDRQTTAA